MTHCRANRGCGPINISYTHTETVDVVAVVMGRLPLLRRGIFCVMRRTRGAWRAFGRP